MASEGKHPRRAPASEARLSLIDDLLSTAGWTTKDNGLTWSVPAHYPRSFYEAFRAAHGSLRSWHRRDAISFMTHFDQSLVERLAS